MKKGFIFLTLFAVFSISFAAFAQTNAPDSALGHIDPGDKAGSSGGITVNALTDAILILINWFSWLIGVAAVVMGLYAGFLFITARDDAKQITTARDTMLWAIIGIAVAIFAFGIVSITKTILQI